MRDRRDILRKADLRRTLNSIGENFRSFQVVLNELKEKDLSACNRCLKVLENIQPLLIKLYKDLDDINPKRS